MNIRTIKIYSPTKFHVNRPLNKGVRAYFICSSSTSSSSSSPTPTQPHFSGQVIEGNGGWCGMVKKINGLWYRVTRFACNKNIRKWPVLPHESKNGNKIGTFKKKLRDLSYMISLHFAHHIVHLELKMYKNNNFVPLKLRKMKKW